jgi:metal-responsive CopG/Arc/MetJ family transcriptional regulator
MKTLTVKLKDDLYTRLESMAEERGWSKSALVRAALESLVRDQRPSQGPSCYDLAEDLSGTVDGPRDLSTSKRHLRGYGR